MVKSKSHENKPKVYFHSRYDGDTLEGTHLQNAHFALVELFDLCSSSEADFSISLDYSAGNLSLLTSQNITPRRRFLLVREPKQVHPYPHSKKARSDFGSIYFLGTVDEKTDLVQFWPYTREFDATAADFAASTPVAREDKVVAIASWRVSFIRGALYSLRARAFSKLTIDTFGRGWNAPIGQKAKEVIAQVLMAAGNEFGLAKDLAPQIFFKPSNYKGSLASKFETLQGYKATLIIENSTDYMSEKVLDAFASATIPIYCGTSLSRFGIPDDLYINCAPNLESVREAVAEALDVDYASWRERLLSWLLTEEGNELFHEKLQWQRLFAHVRDEMIQEQINEVR
jgi:hypothetical protein